MPAPLFPRALIATLLCLGSLPAASPGIAAPVGSSVVRAAPDFWLGALPGTNNESLKAQKGRPVILLLARSPETGAFRSQMKEIAARFDRLSTRNVLVVAAFEKLPERGFDGLVRSDVPVVVAPQGGEVCRQYRLQGKSAIVLIGPDGNMDYMTSKILNASRISQVIGNSFEFQHDPKRRPYLSPDTAAAPSETLSAPPVDPAGSEKTR